MQHITLGTAGHVDHGKTAIINALTGFDCDTHPQEKQRGITINLGFTSLDAGNGLSIGVVDVPGHKDFINTMVAGALGINLAMLVIAANEGIMPQTVEHLHIMDMLGIKAGLVLLSKADLVDKAELEALQKQVQAFVSNTFLQGCPIVAASAKTGQGITQLKQTIASQANKVFLQTTNGIFCLHIDRWFSLAGHGTIVNGTVASGSANTNSNLVLIPGYKSVRIRAIQRHHKPAEAVFAGDRASFNLPGVEAKSLTKGMALCGANWTQTSLIDANITLLDGVPALNLWQQVTLISGVAAIPAKTHLLSCNNLPAGQQALAQVHLHKPLLMLPFSRFIIRSTDNRYTLGGGVVLDQHPLLHRRRKSLLVNTLTNILQHGFAGLAKGVLARSKMPMPNSKLAFRLGLTVKQLANYLSKSSLEFAHIQLGDEEYICLKSWLQTMQQQVKQAVVQQNGLTAGQVAAAMQLGTDSEQFIVYILKGLQQQQVVTQTVNKWYSATIVHKISVEQQLLQRFFADAGYTVPDYKQIKADLHAHGVADLQWRKLIDNLINSKQIVNLGGTFIDADIYKQALTVLHNWFSNNSSGITVAGYRDLLKSNRKFCLLILGWCDKLRLTERKGDVRFRGPGWKFLQ